MEPGTVAEAADGEPYDPNDYFTSNYDPSSDPMDAALIARLGSEDMVSGWAGARALSLWG